jgi:hypothetical protein
MLLQILIQIDEMNRAGLLKVAIELDAFAMQFQPIVNAIIDSEVTVIVFSDDDACMIVKTCEDDVDMFHIVLMM